MAFNGFGAGSITYNVNASSVTKQIVKQVFASNVICTGTSESRLGADNYQDLWWNPQESGWGINFAHQGDILFATLFTYDRNGADLWLVASAMTKQSDGSYSGALFKTTGVAFNAATWRSATAAEVGSMSVKFSDGEDGILTYVFNGTSVTKPIKRQTFAAVVPMCR